MLISAKDLKEIEGFREANLNLKAYDLAKKFGPFEQWEGTDALINAAHLSYNLGAPERSWRLTSRAWRRDRANPRAVFYFAIDLLSRRGPLPALIFMRRFPEYKADARLTSWWFSLYAHVHAILRDFTAAASWHKKAVAASPDDSWVWTARSFVLEQQDRYDEALETARKGLELEPTRRSAVSAVAHYLTLLEKNDEALQLLTSVVEKVENWWLAKELADLQSELGMHLEAYEIHRKILELAPLIEPKVGEWIYGGISDAAYFASDLSGAKSFAEKAANPFYTKILENLNASSPDAKNVLLDVRFLRQHHVTCAPATLSNIGRYWKKKAEHLDLVEQMCYDGTPSYKERLWAEANGWVTREFTLNWKDATALLDRGIPLTLATVYPGGGHLQAIIGYDERRGTFLVRDPYYPRTSEFIAEELLKDQKANGPRVMALVPEASRNLFDGIGDQLFESELYDLLFEIDSALEAHDRNRAGDALSKLEEKFSGHRLSLVAHWTISAYDSNTLGILSALKQLRDLFPDDVNLRLSDVNMSAEFTGRLERIATLERYSLTKPTDPILWQMFGYELGVDSKEHRRALHWLGKSVRKAPGNALTYRLIADILWAQRRFEEAVEMYRFATSLNDMDEAFAYSYFLAIRHLKREEEAIEILRDRFKRFGKRSGLPVRSLFAALRDLGRVDEAFSALDDAMKLRPNDGELLLYAADMKARYGSQEAADDLLRRAESRSPKSIWLRVSASIAHLRGDPETALQNWREVLADDPIATDAHESVANLLKGSEGAEATKEYLRKACRKFPTNRSLQVLRLQHLDHEPGEAIAVLRDLIRTDPGDTWSLRELSYWYEQVGKFDRALQSAEQAVAVDPNDAVSRWFRGRALETLRRYPEAAEEYRTSIRLNVNYPRSISSWIGISRSLDEKREILSEVWRQLNSQASVADGLFAYREEARLIAEPKALLKDLEDFAAENRRSWPAASVVIQQLAEMGRDEQAVAKATEATQRFPLVHQTWLDLALVHRLTGNVNEEIDSLRMATTVNPLSSYCVQMLTEAYQRAGRFEEARDLLLTALTRMPFDNFLLGYLADIYWMLGERNAAIDTAQRAIEVEPGYRWAWAAIKRWAEEIGDDELPVTLARQLAEKKPKDVRVWINLADMLATGVFSHEEMNAIDRALSLDPFSPTALAMKADALAGARRFDEAIKVARTNTPDGYRPEQLRFVEAGIEAMRGNMARSVEVLKELTETSPGYLPGWTRLAEIYRLDDKHTDDYKRVALEMVRLAPREATSFGYLVEACMKLDQKQEAREALEQAVILDRSYEYAVMQLFDIYTESDDIPAAETLVASVIPVSPVVGLPLAVEIAAKKKDKTEALSSFERLLTNESVTRDRLNRVFEKLATAFGADRAFIDIMRQQCARGNVNAAVGRFLIHGLWQSNKRECEEFLKSIEGNRTLWAETAVRYMELLVEQDHDALRRFVDKNSERLAFETESWGSVGYHLVNINDISRAMRWYEGWEQRQDVMPWMLWNYSIILRRTGRSSDATKVNSAALDLRFDDTVNSHLTFLALDEFGASNPAHASAIFSNINPTSMTDWERFFYDLLSLCIEADSSVSAANLNRAKEIVREIVSKMVAFDPKANDVLVKEIGAPVVRALLQSIGSTWFTLWTKIRLYMNGFT